MGDFRADNVLLGRSRITIRGRGREGSVEGLPPALKLRSDPRLPLYKDLAN
jgi:hypothetical protein